MALLLEPAGGKAVAAHIMGAIVAGDKAREIDRPALVEEVVGVPAVHVGAGVDSGVGADHPFCRADVDDGAAALLRHDVAERPCHDEEAGGIDAHAEVEIRRIIPVAGHRPQYRVVDEHVERGAFRADRVAQRTHARLVALEQPSRMYGKPLIGEAGGEFFQRREVSRGHIGVRARLRQGLDDLPAVQPGAARDHGGFSGK